MNFNQDLREDLKLMEVIRGSSLNEQQIRELAELLCIKDKLD